MWEACSNQQSDYNPLYPYMCLALGVLSACLSLLWVLHICLYVLIPEEERFTLFLNLYFMQVCVVATTCQPSVVVTHCGGW